ncbi:MAG: 16S rRNA (guanine(527)-N(7))-methyltransferase RsmG [Oceanospirillaceae bacterium]|uniref:16S rRNA (guanine(527)-N(7))-methyltransferase RsmG n=1 Tax=unclassified Thalassolituus TaxID=2624967 RepID=UPI000C42AB1C|nr:MULTISPECIES: 16S rRNA (guanine(527)-N(7))-methyltransferase RsmG [unclassified Thalassolituus]MAS24493.1 16S rRNA (guanine(527)-N(7))-methyltransferase RsmG [Oceanospirillaceae bacterium]MAX98600.1 16S rRNA (guanine(527)-N(7))-methyltransferase RsmG [Oceanospirillaceae bacterium]MBL34361.1 16S rRNA (guanine(527)-N(7))-methyltransferase RsmG [Oceanospirillaceae bacterium]MBS51816.1 16S rRNA (guanine(527)-N(7))-methyltransferase RsmG [Oceanospirillaceae bacterium]|tara:strand:+ start:1937 stop:2578 length:642 start_codon:yes stop_codon:yes gene_type:complete
MTDSNDALKARLLRGASAMQIELTDAQADALMDYLGLFQKWNKAYNLTAIREPQSMVDLHLLDSLAVHPYVQEANTIIDVGTGPGLPGVVLAIMNPHKQFTLLDSNGKKTRFLFQARTALQLENLTIVNDRVEAYHPPQPFDMIVSRAFASLADMTTWCRHLRADDGCFLAMKGQYPDDELRAIEDEFKLVASHAIEVPGVEGERHLLRLVPR